MKMNDFADAVKNKPNQTQPVVSLSNLLQTNHPIFQKNRQNPLFSDFFLFFYILFFLLPCRF